MDITIQRSGDHLDITVNGRLDAAWADHLTHALEESVRGGAHRLRVDMAAVSFMSSVGIRVLVRFYKQLQRINGSFVVVRPSDAVSAVLELAGLHALLVPDASPEAATAATSGRHVEHEAVTFEVFDLAPSATLTCRVVGDPALLVGGRFESPNCHPIRFPETTFGVGLGAFGTGFTDCQTRFGEFLAAGGAATYLPTDGSNVPDYVATQGAMVPEVQVLYGLTGEGQFASLARFEATEGGAVTLSTLAECALDFAGADVAGLVVVAEAAGLVGAALRRSPVGGATPSAPFAYPEIRDWLSFTPERAFPRSLVLVVGVAARGNQPELPVLLRSMHEPSNLTGHFHAAAFTYRALQKGRIDLPSTVAMLFAAEGLQGVLHLLGDDRPTIGAGQSEFVRGACWVGPIRDITSA